MTDPGVNPGLQSEDSALFPILPPYLGITMGPDSNTHQASALSSWWLESNFFLGSSVHVTPRSWWGSCSISLSLFLWEIGLWPSNSPSVWSLPPIQTLWLAGPRCYVGPSQLDIFFLLGFLQAWALGITPPWSITLFPGLVPCAIPWSIVTRT